MKRLVFRGKLVELREALGIADFRPAADIGLSFIGCTIDVEIDDRRMFLGKWYRVIIMDEEETQSDHESGQAEIECH